MPVNGFAESMSSVMPTVKVVFVVDVAALPEGLGEALSAADAVPLSSTPAAKVATAVAASSRVERDGLSM
jgi:hypothetical protein